MEKSKKILEKAKKTAGDKQEMKGLVTQVTSKLKSLAADTPQWKEFKSKIHILIRMIQCHISGEYKAFSTSSIVLTAFALIYFLTPFDAIPDFIPAIGFTDDATVLLMVYRKIKKDIEAFLKWSGPDSTDS